MLQAPTPDAEPESAGLVLDSFAAGVGPFLLYFVLGLALTAAFVAAYTALTPHEELKLVKEDKTSAAISLGGAMLGFALPIAYLIAQSVSVLDFVLWGITAGIVQLAAFFGFRFVFPKISERITGGETAAPTVLAAMHVVVGIVNAASMTY